MCNRGYHALKNRYYHKLNSKAVRRLWKDFLREADWEGAAYPVFGLGYTD